MEHVTITHPDTGRTVTIFPTEGAIAREKARGYDTRPAEKAAKAWAKAHPSTDAKADAHDPEADEAADEPKE